MTTIDSTTNSTASSPSNAAALESVLPALRALPTTSLRPVNLDVEGVVLAITGALPVLVSLRPAIAAALGEAIAANIDELPLYVQAMTAAHADYLIALAPADVQALSEATLGEREVLLADALALVKRKLVQAGELGELRGSVGFSNQIFDVFQLVSLYRKHWAQVDGHTGVKLAELERAEHLARDFARALSERETPAAEASACAEVRQRTFTKLLDLYDQVRRAMMYLRWMEGDAESLAPSLWAGRGHRPGQGVLAGNGAAPTAAPVAAGGPSAPAATAPASVTAPAAATVPAAAPIGPGLPGNSPFITR